MKSRDQQERAEAAERLGDQISAFSATSCSKARRVTAILGGAVVVTLFSMLGLWLAHRPEKPVEVPRFKLVLRDGRLYQINASNAFTGVMIERYEGGLLKSRSSVLDGRLDGLSEGWHTNGQPQVIEHFQAGVSEGPRIKFYASGGKQSESRITAGQFNGTFRRWFESGRLAEQVEFHNGQPEGVSVSYFETGFVKARATMRSGALVEHHAWNDGEVAALPAN